MHANSQKNIIIKYWIIFIYYYILYNTYFFDILNNINVIILVLFLFVVFESYIF